MKPLKVPNIAGFWMASTAARWWCVRWTWGVTSCCRTGRLIRKKTQRGVRGIRLTLQRPQVMESQLRALLRSADNRPLRIMFPMVGSVAEWRAARDMTERLRQQIPVA